MAFSRIVRVPSTGSTNTDLMAALDSAPDEWPHMSVLTARTQTAGRGRSGRSWQSVAGDSLTCSVVLLPSDAHPPTPWIPLLAGLAVRRALAPWLETALKWPNDVLVASGVVAGGGAAGGGVAGGGGGAAGEGVAGGDAAGGGAAGEGAAGGGAAAGKEWGWAPKLGGVLSELHRSGAVVAGIGINCRQQAGELPVPWAASIASASGTPGPDPDEVLLAIGETLAEVWRDWAADPARVRAEYAANCVVVGEQVGVVGPGDTVVGTAVGIGEDGSLLVDRGDAVVAVLAGDVWRVRPAG